jgi:hypothetical protein
MLTRGFTRQAQRSTSPATHGLPHRRGMSWRLATPMYVLTGCIVVLGPLVAPSAVRAQETQPPDAREETRDKWLPLFDGKTLDGWKVTDFGGQGDIGVQDGAIVMGMGSMLTGITCDQKFPRCDYEVRWEGQRVDGVDFFSTLTFPVGDACCSLVVGGWGGAVVGISCLDYADASQNETTRYVKFNKGQWYRFRVQVRRDRLQVWIDDESVVDVDIRDRKLTTRIEVKRSEPLGFATWETRGAVRKIEYRQLEPDL